MRGHDQFRLVLDRIQNGWHGRLNAAIITHISLGIERNVEVHPKKNPLSENIDILQCFHDILLIFATGSYRFLFIVSPACPAFSIQELLPAPSAPEPHHAGFVRPIHPAILHIDAFPSLQGDPQTKRLLGTGQAGFGASGQPVFSSGKDNAQVPETWFSCGILIHPAFPGLPVRFEPFAWSYSLTPIRSHAR
jgi:hypothetical protein